MFKAKSYLDMQDVLVQLSIVGRTDAGSRVIKNSRANLINSLNELIVELDQPELEMCRMAAERMQKHLIDQAADAQIISDADDLRGRLLDQIESICLLALSSSEKGLYAPDEPLFGNDVQAKFASSTYEIDEAGKCLAISRSTASVFHLMRILEIAIGAIRQCLGIRDPLKATDRNWGKILASIKDAIDQKTGWRRKDKDLFLEAYAHLDAVRAAWRNSTMHVEKTYTPEEAENVFRVVKGFMQTISTRMDENGDPKA